MNIIKPDRISLSTHHLHLSFNDSRLATGSGFIYECREQLYLVTNWHNVTGTHPTTKKYISETGSKPNKVTTYFRDKANPGLTHKETIDLYADTNKYLDPVWIEHPEHKENVDVVVMPIPDDLVARYVLFPINKNDFETDVPEEVADEAFVIGYPFSDPQYLQLPIWKKASIATEPTVNHGQLPKILIDTATRSGLSGSPVIMQRTGIHKLGPDGNLTRTSLIGRIRTFIGVYSGRIDDAELKAQLGIVWKARIIEEIIGGPKDKD